MTTEERMPALEVVRMEVPREVEVLVRGDRPSEAPRPADRSVPRRPSNRQLLRRALSSPSAARQGFLLREVLGPPVSLRSEATDRPS